MEAHGTGTSLGDPIEIQGLVRAFNTFTKDKQFCSIGSVKSNIGHAESAAGISGLTKVILQLYYKTLVPSLHAEPVNPYLQMASTPFYIQQRKEEWKQPVVVENQKERVLPRRAAVSSFGATGSNAHVILEEYGQEESSPTTVEDLAQVKRVMIPISAKNDQRLREYAQNLLDFVQRHCPQEKGQEFKDKKGNTQPSLGNALYNRESAIDLEEFAYTLQTGRRAMEERLVFLVNSLEELREKLQRFVEGKDVGPNCWSGHVMDAKNTLSLFGPEELREMVEKWLEQGNLKKIGRSWAQGININWEELYHEKNPKRMSLPTYPFARERYWISDFVGKNPNHKLVRHSHLGDGGSKNINHKFPWLHPLVHQNTSTLERQQFNTTLTGSEFFLAYHNLLDEKVLPEFALLEMAQEAIRQALGNPPADPQGLQLKKVSWDHPIIIGNHPQDIHIDLFPKEEGEIAYEIFTDNLNEAEPLVHSYGSSILIPAAKGFLDLPNLHKKFCKKSFNSKACYEAYKAMGMEFGSAHRKFEKLYLGEGKVLAKLSLPSPILETLEQFTLHPHPFRFSSSSSNRIVFKIGNRPFPYSLRPTVYGLTFSFARPWNV